jgi:8-oxo-dGTP diphosphatase
LPKGKLARGEHPFMAAQREVTEETGIRPVMGPRLPTCYYNTVDGPKSVEYWAMRAEEAGVFVASAEVDELVWLSISEARRRLSYARDIDLLDAAEAVAMGVDTVVLVVRHASAGDKDQWYGDDTERPLDAQGHRDAQTLRIVLAAFAPTVLMSADYRRFIPLAADLGLTVLPEPTLGEENYVVRPDATVARIRELSRSRSTVAVCSQGDVIPGLVEAIAKQDGLALGKARAKKGSIWALFFANAKLITADYYPHANG